MIVDKFEYAELNVVVHLICFRPEILFLGKFVSKNQNCQFELKSVTWTNSNTQSSMAMFTIYILD